MINRLGRSVTKEHRAGSVIKDITIQFNDPKNWECITGDLYKGVIGTGHVDLDAKSCKKLKDAMEALTQVITQGPTIVSDRFVGKSSASLPPSNYIFIAGTAFYKTPQYKDSRIKPNNWDQLPIDPNGPLAQ